MNNDEIRELFREMREEAVPADSLARVRIAVAAGKQRSPVWRRQWWIPLLIAACCGIALLFLRPVAVPVPAMPQMPPAPVVAHQRAPVELPKAETRRVVQRVRQAPQPSQVPGTVVRIETNDPDVVILLVSD